MFCKSKFTFAGTALYRDTCMAQDLTKTKAHPHASMPEGVGNAYLFQVFNTISFSIVLTTPMLLYFKGLGASGTILGIVTALPALLNILQMPAARFVEQVGYRTFVLRGWSLRSLFILGMAGVAFLPAKIDPTTKMALMLFLLFAYNTSRGISVCGFLPWITQWIPEEVRGWYLSRDQMCQALASVGTMLLMAGYLRQETSRHAFGAVFLASFIAATMSLLFLRKIPDVPPPQSSSPAGTTTTAGNPVPPNVPWKEMALYPPFFRLLVYNVIIFAALAGGGVFWVPCLRDQFHLSDAQILLFGAITPTVMAACLFWLGHVVDRVGSRPVLALANVTLAVHLLLWGSLASHFMPLAWWSVLLIQCTSGIAIAALNLGNQRLAMSIVPATGRSHFLALFSVVNGLTLGILPVGWGIALDSLAGWRHGWYRWEWNQFSTLYLALVMIAVGAQVWHTRLTEPRAMTTEEFFRELLVKTPARAITRLISRRPFS
jgi:MFS family permease